MAVELQVGALGADEQTDLRRALWNHTSKVVLSRTEPLPGSPAAGDIYIMPFDDPGNPNEIAFYYESDWQMLVPEEGWTAYVVDEGENVQFDGSAWAVSAETHAIHFVIDGGGATITTGVKGDMRIPFDCTIVEWTLLADLPGSIVVDVWKSTFASFPPVVGGAITASAKPTLSGAVSATNTTLTGWTTTITAGDVLRYNVNSATTITRVTLSLKVEVA